MGFWGQVVRCSGGLLVVLAGLAPLGGAWAQASPAAYMSATRYDAARRVTGTIAPDPDGATGPLHWAAVRNTYDAGGRLIRVETGELAAWKDETVAPADWGTDFVLQTKVTIAYDALDRKIRETTYATSNTPYRQTQYRYDAAGRLECTAVRMNSANFSSPPTDICTPDTQGSAGPDRITRNSYDAAGQLLKVQKAYGITTAAGYPQTLQQDYVAYTYTPNGKQETVTDANGNKAQMVYDGFDRLIAWEFPSKTTTGAIAACTIGTITEDANGVASPSTSRGSGDDCEKYASDRNGNRAKLIKRDGSVITYQYDALNRVTSKGGDATAVTYTYDLQGHQLTAKFAGTGRGITNSWDGFGRQLSTASDLSGTTRTLGYSYDADGNRQTLTFPDAKVWTYSYDGLDRLSGIKEGTTTAVVSVTYNARGLPSSRTVGGVTTSYGYTGINQLSSIADALAGTADDVTTTLTYNPAGQIVSKVRTNDSYRFTGYAAANRDYSRNGLNQYTAAGSASFCYDGNGDLTLSSGTAVYKYDVENRLTSVRAPGTSTCSALDYTGPLQASLAYDPLGRLYQGSGGASGTTQYLYDGDQLVAEYNGSGAIVRRYVYGLGEDDPLLWYEGAGITDRRSLQSDHQGSIVSVADATGTAMITDAYDEYGIPSSTAADGGSFRYTGQLYLKDLGLYHYKARVYSPTLGRFLQTDPVGYQDQINLYAYVANDPINNADPTGLECGTRISGAIGAGCSGGSTLELMSLGLGGANATPPGQKQDNAGRGGDGRVLNPKDNGPPPDDAPPARALTGWGKITSLLGAILSLGGDSCPSCNLSLDGALEDPKALTNTTLDQFRERVGTPSGWVWTRSFQGSNAGRGWALREWGGKDWTGRQIRWHPGGGRHGPNPYWRVNNGRGQSPEIPSGGRW